MLGWVAGLLLRVGGLLLGEARLSGGGHAGRSSVTRLLRVGGLLRIGWLLLGIGGLLRVSRLSHHGLLHHWLLHHWLLHHRLLHHRLLHHNWLDHWLCLHNHGLNDRLCLWLCLRLLDSSCFRFES